MTHSFILRLALAVSLAAITLGPPLASQSPENILVIVADDLGVDYVGAYGEGRNVPPTPNIDRLANEGVLFRNTWAYPYCSPARAALLTGRHPLRHYVGRWIRYTNNNSPRIGVIDRDEYTIPELLDRSDSGYSHAAIGKWHMNDITQGVTAPTVVAGYDTFTGHLRGGFTGNQGYFRWPRVENGVEQITQEYLTTKATDDALDWIQAQTGPWFCYLAYFAPHVPFHVPPGNLHTQNVTSSSSNRDKYRAMIEAMDTEMGRLFSSIDPTTLANTHIIFVGDNGSVQNMAVAPFNGSRAKGTPYEGGINVPLIYKGPATVQPGREVAGLTCIVDIFSTVLDLAGASSAIPAWHAVDGVSFAPYLRNPEQPALRRYAYSELFTGDVWPAPLNNGYAIVRNNRYKLIARTNGDREFFDLTLDPFERVDLTNRALTPLEQQNLANLLAEVNRLRSPTGRCQIYGVGCTGSRGVPLISCSGRPAFGALYSVNLDNAAPNSLAVFAMDLFAARSNPRLPIDLSVVGAGVGCALWLDLEVTLGLITDASGRASIRVPTPPQLAAMELTALHGWFVADPSAPNNPLGLVNTAGLATVVGL